MIRIPKISCANLSLVRPISASTLMITVVDDIESMAPRNRLSVLLQPKSLPSSKPTQPIPRISSEAAMTAVPPTFLSLPRLNSSPSENMSRMMPISASVLMLSWLVNSGNGGVCGPMMKPARM